MMKRLAVAVVVSFTAGAPAAAQTLIRDIAPILQKSSQSCHRPGQMAPIDPDGYVKVEGGKAAARVTFARAGTCTRRAFASGGLLRTSADVTIVVD